MRLIDVIIGICWIIFWVYWIAAAFRAKRGFGLGNMRVFFWSRLGMVILAAVVVTIFHHLPESFTSHPLGVSVITGIGGLVVFLVGFVLAIWARVSLGADWGMPMTVKNKPNLVTSGPYRMIRHPIYTGMLLMFLGSVVSVNMYWLVVFIVGGSYFIFSAFIEERTMLRQFPKTFPAYKRSTKMLLPFIF